MPPEDPIHVPNAQMVSAIASLREDQASDWRTKLRDLVLGLHDIGQLEEAGKALNSDQILDILTASREWDQAQQSKLPSLFVGLPHTVFADILAQLNPIQLGALKHESLSGPVQHHLTLFIHETERQLSQDADALAQLQAEIQQLDTADITFTEIQAIKQKIEAIRNQYDAPLEKLKQALAIAWNTNRTDLIEKLSSLRESCQKVCQDFIGQSATSQTRSSGLYDILEGRLNQVYGDPNDPQDIEALKDDEPAIEALMRFSIWYLRDYWGIGLLPSIQSENQLDLGPALHDENERTAYREKLFAEVEQNLRTLGIVTLRDLKQLGIYSKKGLVTFIQERT
jgi:hypothetical protein